MGVVAGLPRIKQEEIKMSRFDRYVRERRNGRTAAVVKHTRENSDTEKDKAAAEPKEGENKSQIKTEVLPAILPQNIIESSSENTTEKTNSDKNESGPRRKFLPKRKTKHWLVGANLILALTGLVTVWLNGKLVESGKQQAEAAIQSAKAAEKSTSIAEKALIISQRPRIGAIGIRFTMKAGNTATAELTFQNTGNVAAREVVTYLTSVVRYPHEVGPDDCPEPSSKVIMGMISKTTAPVNVPRVTDWRSSHPFNEEMIRSIKDKKVWLYFWWRAEYVGDWEDKKYFTEYYARYDPIRNKFDSCPNHNDSD